MKISDHLIKSGQSAKGGWTRKQLQLLGVEWPPKQGWRRRVIGREIDKSAAEEFLALVGKQLSSPLALDRGEAELFSDALYEACGRDLAPIPSRPVGRSDALELAPWL